MKTRSQSFTVTDMEAARGLMQMKNMIGIKIQPATADRPRRACCIKAEQFYSKKMPSGMTLRPRNGNFSYAE